MRALVLTLLGVAIAQPASAATWIEGAQEEAWLGFSVAGAGDVDCDGFGDALAGAPRDGGGVALLLRGSAAGAGAIAPLRIESDQANAMLGSFVSGATCSAPRRTRPAPTRREPHSCSTARPSHRATSRARRDAYSSTTPSPASVSATPAPAT
jgi:hypothetical protein